MIVVTCPFDNTEATWAGLRLAGQFQEWQREVAVFAWPRQATGTAWDRRGVWSAKQLIRHAEQVRILVRLECDPGIQEFFQELFGRKSRPRRFLVPSWHRLRDDCVNILSDQEVVVCPSRFMPAALYRKLEGRKKPRLVTWANFDSGLAPIRRDGLLGDGGRMKVGMVCDRWGVAMWGWSILETADILVRQLDGIDVTLASSVSFPREQRRYVRELRRLHGRRFQLARIRRLDQYDQFFHEHDWVIFVSPKSDFAFLAVRALCCGAGVMVPELPPYSELIRDGINGVTLACDIHEEAWYAPVTRTPPTSWLSRLVAVLSEPRWLLALQTRDWMVTTLRKQFCDLWEGLLDNRPESS